MSNIISHYFSSSVSMQQPVSLIFSFLLTSSLTDWRHHMASEQHTHTTRGKYLHRCILCIQQQIPIYMHMHTQTCTYTFGTQSPKTNTIIIWALYHSVALKHTSLHTHSHYCNGQTSKHVRKRGGELSTGCHWLVCGEEQLMPLCDRQS